MAWITTKDGRRVDTEWFTEDERKKYQQIKENQKQADEKKTNEPQAFKNGDTPKVLNDSATYRVKKISVGKSSDSDYGNLRGEDAKGVLKGFHYEELFAGQGMWYKDGVGYGFDVKWVK